MEIYIKPLEGSDYYVVYEHGRISQPLCLIQNHIIREAVESHLIEMSALALEALLQRVNAKRAVTGGTR